MKSKICGISDSNTLEHLTNHPHPPHFVGFVVNYPKSKRFVEHDKLKKLLKAKIIIRNKKLEYILSNEGKFNKKIYANYLVNQRHIALFITDIFNLIKRSPLKIWT